MKVDKVLLVVFGALIIIGAGAALFTTSRAPSSSPNQSVAVSPKPAPDFKLELFSGQTIVLKDFTGKRPVVINFWASWCPPCRDEAPTLAKVSKMYEGRVEFIGVVINDTQANALAFMKEFGISYDNGIDQDNVSGKYGISGIPETFWIDKQGQLVGHWIGAIDEANLTSRIQKLIQ
ncbi:MAG: TlpA disulfide reductase family protein [Dehalococcoidales bacterium]|nr:TlpA disulfide reductase family protein [Dehalococcoidales bacterium]